MKRIKMVLRTKDLITVRDKREKKQIDIFSMLLFYFDAFYKKLESLNNTNLKSLFH